MDDKQEVKQHRDISPDILEQITEDALSFTHSVKHIALVVSAISDSLPPGEERNKILSRNRKLLALADDYLTCLRLKCDNLQPQPSRLQLAEYLREKTIDLHSTDGRLFGFTEIAIDIPEDLHIEIDKKVLGVIVDNILENSLKYASSNPAIRISATVSNAADCSLNGKQEIEIVFVDNGRGVPENELHKIFEHGYRATNVNNIPGDGSGLYIIRRLIERCGGNIHAENNKNGGLMVVLKFPEKQHKG
ncbi:MAG: ATP-binding protein [bacterium]|nr:ATP-binding protein [bacterium]